jgi:hypothetical protein
MKLRHCLTPGCKAEYSETYSCGDSEAAPNLVAANPGQGRLRVRRKKALFYSGCRSHTGRTKSFSRQISKRKHLAAWIGLLGATMSRWWYDRRDDLLARDKRLGVVRQIG